jgi:hypothetical protein
VIVLEKAKEEMQVSFTSIGKQMIIFDLHIQEAYLVMVFDLYRSRKSTRSVEPWYPKFEYPMDFTR